MVLEQNSGQELERILTEIAITFINLRTENIDSQIDTALRQLVLSLGFDRSTLIQLTGENRIPLATHCWAREGYPVRTGYSFAEQFPYIYGLMEKHCLPQFFPNIEAVPESEEKDRRMLTLWGPRAMFCFPLNADGKTIGWITLGTFSNKKLSDDMLHRLSLLGSIFVGALMKKQTDSNLREQLLSENLELRSQIYSTRNRANLIGESKALRLLTHKIEQVAPTDATVLILGETGTGKELVAHRIHELSSKSSRAMLSVNCAGLSPYLLESEMFGHEKGAFTGAYEQKKGRFEAADGSSLFLDEIGELPVSAQAKLLRVLQERQLERVGSSKSVTVNVRILAATNRDLQHEIRQGKFREDLYYRLDVFPIRVPPLRERREDIPLMVEFFMHELMTSMGKNIKRIRKQDLKALQEYDWPGNVRELRNSIERALILSKGPVLSIPHPGKANAPLRIPRTLLEVEREHILKTLAQTGWRVSGEKGAAKILGINAKTLESRMKRLGISRPGKEPADEYLHD